MTLVEKHGWSGVKPLVEFFRVFGRVSHVHVPDNTRSKLDDKSFSWVLLGVSGESKAYRLYNPISKRIVISRDIVCEEEKCWDLDKTYEAVITCNSEWGDETNEETSLEETEDEDEDDVDVEDGDAADVHEKDSSCSVDSVKVDSSASSVGERNRMPPFWMRGYVSGEGLFEEENVSHFLLFSTTDHVFLRCKK
ncbi:hypothetical protein HRI_002032800 [Hibiscus trionum]|uniref:Retroviral polymerase SH3-like domain-containing protein n=1 Tax=Hibiscus trionum TaxID=183268 RepID=A0A9W7HXB5_HIBTR|nr:hypothetical protein HRI_002032800 [Hibiscus trionum]